MLDFFGDIGSFIMTPLYYAISFVLVPFHTLFSTFLRPGGRRGVGAVDHRADRWSSGPR